MVHPRPCVAFRAFKRIFDITSACLGLVLLSPLLLGTALAVKATSPGPVIFKQERYGRNKKPFVCFKFRSMMADTPADVPTRVIHENQSVMTPIGATLRKTSIDELPQLLNIVRGDMSAVGPRPTADIPLPMLARHPDRCSDRLGAPERARLYSVSIHPPACRRAFRQAGRPVLEETTVSLGVVPLCL